MTMRGLSIVLFFALVIGCGGAEVRGLRKSIEITAVSLKATDEVISSTMAIIEPTIADQVRSVCKEERECIELYRKQLEPYSYATDTLAAAVAALKALEASVDMYEDAGDNASLMILVEDMNTLAYILTDLIAQFKGLGIVVPSQLESALARLEAITAGVKDGNRK